MCFCVLNIEYACNLYKKDSIWLIVLDFTLMCKNGWDKNVNKIFWLDSQTWP